jgi:hypothetical protein
VQLTTPYKFFLPLDSVKLNDCTREPGRDSSYRFSGSHKLSSSSGILSHIEQLNEKRKNRVHFHSPFLPGRRGTRLAGLSGCRVEREKKGEMVRSLLNAANLKRCKKNALACNDPLFSGMDGIAVINIENARGVSSVRAQICT